MSKNDKENDQDYDIVIVGAGPGGCSFARSLSKDYNVLLIDQSFFPRNKPCGGLLVEESKEFFSNINIPEHIFSKPKELDMRTLDLDNNLEKKQKRSIWNVDRMKFDSFLLSMCKDSVDFFSGTRLLDFRTKNGKINLIVEFGNERRIIKSKYIIGGDGASSLVRRKIEREESKKIRLYLGVQEWIPRPKSISTFDYILSSDITDFYSWAIPKGEFTIIGAALSLTDNISKKMDLFRTKLRRIYGLFLKPLKREGALIARPLTTENINLGVNNVLLIGESAGLISPSTSEGVSFALRSGYYCAQAFNKNFENPIDSYKKLCEPLIKEIEKKIIKANILSNIERRRDVLDKLEK